METFTIQELKKIFMQIEYVSYMLMVYQLLKKDMWQS